jgi:hypothetical protein
MTVSDYSRAAANDFHTDSLAQIKQHLDLVLLHFPTPPVAGADNWREWRDEHKAFLQARDSIAAILKMQGDRR